MLLLKMILSVLIKVIIEGFAGLKKKDSERLYPGEALDKACILVYRNCVTVNFGYK